MSFRRKRADTKVARVEQAYARDFGVRGDMELGTLLALTGCRTQSELLGLSDVEVRRRVARARPAAPEGATYLQRLLVEQALRPGEEQTLRRLRTEYEDLLRLGWEGGAPRFYYAGSVAKNTANRSSYDLDLVTYFPATAPLTVPDLFRAVERRLRSARLSPERRNVALRVVYKGGFHVDVVPAKTISTDRRFANLYVTSEDTTRQTSIEHHVLLVRSSGLQEVIRVLKLWRTRRKVPIGSFLIELAVARALGPSPSGSLEDRARRVLSFLGTDFATARLVDPANTNNVVSDLLKRTARDSIIRAARSAAAQTNWGDIVG